MDIIAIILSGLALILSGFTFYWINIHTHKKFYLLRIDNLSAGFAPEFALINGGNKDILITSLSCGFRNHDGTSCSYPAQQIESDESDSFLLPAGKAFHCKVKFTEPFSPAFAKDGSKEINGPLVLYTMDMKVNIDWIDHQGNIRASSADISKYGFDKTGHIRSRAPLQKKHDLYAQHHGRMHLFFSKYWKKHCTKTGVFFKVWKNSSSRNTVA